LATTANGYCARPRSRRPNHAFAPSEADYSRGAAIIQAYARATHLDQRGAVMLGDEMIDEASRKMAQAIVARG
jgi:citrate lyase subunit beta/citryl-CoA lyase